MRIITQEEHLRKLWGLFCSLTVKAHLYKIFRDRGLDIKWHIIESVYDPDLSIIVVGHVTLYKIRKECYLLRSCLAGRMLLFMAEQVFLLMGEVWLTQNAGAQCAVEGREGRPKDREEFLYLNSNVHYHLMYIKMHHLFLCLFFKTVQSLLAL